MHLGPLSYCHRNTPFLFSAFAVHRKKHRKHSRSKLALRPLRFMRGHCIVSNTAFFKICNKKHGLLPDENRPCAIFSIRPLSQNPAPPAVFWPSFWRVTAPRAHYRGLCSKPRPSHVWSIPGNTFPQGGTGCGHPAAAK